jgi:LL-diaminopimelate aminotransferase
MVTMNTTTINFPAADRIASFKPYFFVILARQIASLKARGVDVIRLDMGSPDLAPDATIIQRLQEQAGRKDTHSYAPSGGTPEFREGVATYYLNRFGVELDPVKEVHGLIGSKEGLFALSQVILNPGDVSLVSDPGYPVYSASGIIAGAEIVSVPLLEKNAFLPDLSSIPEEKLKRAKIIWVNYPNNPTGATANDDFYRELIEFAHRHRVLIAHDLAYADVTYDGYLAPSIMQYDGAMDVSVEFNSLSKSYNMAGWRLGMAVGNPQVLDYLGTYKSQQDTSHFIPVLSAGAMAMTGSQEWLKERNAVYQERRQVVLDALETVGLKASKPKAAIYIWVKIPGQSLSADYCSRLLEETGVSTTPGSVYGQYGEGYLRISLCIPAVRLSEAMNRLTEWVRKTG